MNDIENIFPGLFIIWMSLFVVAIANLLRTDDGPYIFHGVMVIFFTVARVSHTVTYAFKASYARTAAYFVGHLTLLALMIQSLYWVFNLPAAFSR
mmetsp:Transcript_9258/g.15779  ORF Transcript_9258/g.15779 Transcript_9258/m.15779 type:complete len:95 (+) Transcript_9258:1-285(+)